MHSRDRAIGDDKVRVNHQSLDTPLIILQIRLWRSLRRANRCTSPGRSGRPNTSTSTWAGWWTPVTVRKPNRGHVTACRTLLQYDWHRPTRCVNEGASVTRYDLVFPMLRHALRRKPPNTEISSPSMSFVVARKPDLRLRLRFRCRCSATRSTFVMSHSSTMQALVFLTDTSSPAK
jgi:hypothetical protein